MRINLKIHNRNHIIKSILGNVENAIAKTKNHRNGLFVVNYHGTQKKFIPNFIKQLIYFQNSYTIISPSQLNDFYSGKLNADTKPLLLLTFDDGIKNNLFAVDELNKLSLNAFFFIVPDFIDTPIQNQKEYFINHIRPVINANIDSSADDFTSLNWAELKLLINQGHSIGSHTMTHRLVSKHSSQENSEKEIRESKNYIAKKLDWSTEAINTFCSINNTLESISDKELTLIKENYDYHFTTIPGVNLPNSNPLFIKRANIESHWLLGAVKYALGEWDQKRWVTNTTEYCAMLNRKSS